MQNRMFLITLAALLSACTKAGSPPPPGDSVPAPSVPGTSAATSQAAETLGHYTLGDARLDLRGALGLPAEAGVVRVLLTPEELGAEARQAVLASPQFPALVLAQRRIDGYPDRYPFVVVELRHDAVPSASSVRSFYVMASGVREASHTDNINGNPGSDANVAQLQVDGERVRMVFSGRTEITGIPRSWHFDVDI